MVSFAVSMLKLAILLSMTYSHTTMGAAKIAISIDSQLLNQLDELVHERKFANRSQLIQRAVEEKLLRLRKTRLAKELAKIDRKAERQLANEHLAAEAGLWPEY